MCKINKMSKDQYQAHDYYFMDELLSDEHKLIRDSARAWVKKEVSPIIDDYYERAEFPNQILNGLAGIGGFGPYIPEEYGGAGLDQISYGLKILMINLIYKAGFKIKITILNMTGTYLIHIGLLKSIDIFLRYLKTVVLL